MNTWFLIIVTTFGFFVLMYPQQVFACSLAFDIGFVKPWNEYLHGNCSITMGTLSWTGMIYVMSAFIIPLVFIKRNRNLSRKFYLLIPAIVFGVMIFYSAFVYGTPDITQFAVPHGIYGGIDYDTVAWFETDKDFKRMLDEKNIVYSEKNFDTKYDYVGGVDPDNLEYQIIMPANYCGFAISDEGEEYWYTATFDKTITHSELHEENPYDCHGKSKECICGMQERIRHNFLENEN